MLKQKMETIKTFCKEHKKEILTGAIIVAGAIVGYTVCKKLETINSKQTSNNDTFIDAYNKAAEIADKTLIPEINKKYEQYDFSNIENDPVMKGIYDQYINEYEQKFNELLESLR